MLHRRFTRDTEFATFFKKIVPISSPFLRRSCCVLAWIQIAGVFTTAHPTPFGAVAHPTPPLAWRGFFLRSGVESGRR